MKKFILISLIAVAVLAVGFTLGIFQDGWLAPSQEPLQTEQSVGTSTDDQPLAIANPQTAALGQEILGQEFTAEQVQSLISAAGQNAIKQAIKMAGPAVVQIEVTKESQAWDIFERFWNDPFFKRFFGEPPFEEKRVERAIGSGFVIEYEGKSYLLTNNHVIEGAISSRVTFPSGKLFKAEVVGSDPELDVAVLRIMGNSESLPTVKLGDSDKVEIGDWAIAIGNPLGLQHTVTVGIISALDRDVPRPDQGGYFHDIVQTDAAINPGNSGGPLVNAKGEVIGINTAIALYSEGINFAIPVNNVKRVLSQLVEKGKVTRAWLGVYIWNVTEGLAEQFGVKPGEGVLISDVERGAPAEGVLQRGDIVLSVNGQEVKSTDELQQAIMFKKVGEKVSLEIIRNKQKMTVEVELGERPPESELLEQKAQEEESVKKFGITVRSNSEELAAQYGLPTSLGVVVVEVEPSSIAYWAGLEQGDIILEVNQNPVNSVEEWNQLISQVEKGETVMLTIMKKDGITRYLTLKLE